MKFSLRLIPPFLVCVVLSPVLARDLDGSSPVESQAWNLHVQNTDVVQGYPGFPARYSGPNSLPTGGQVRQSISLNVTAGLRLWPGAQACIDGMMWQGFGLNNTLGVAGFPNGEAFRLGTAVPNGAITRLFVRQTFGLGGVEESVPDAPLTLAGTQEASRLTVTLGRFNAKDVFDNNAYANDPRTQFMNWALMANEAWDYPADAIGYTTGMAAEWTQAAWALRGGLFQLPSVSNGLTYENRFLKWPYDGAAASGPILESWGSVVELEHRHVLREHPGAVRFLAYLNRAHMGSYSAAVDAATRPPDIVATRDYRHKFGFGLNVEQELAANVGFFSRLGWSDGRNEAWVFSDVDYTLTSGVSIRGESWGRPEDTLGCAGILNGLSGDHQAFFKAGGRGILSGDGTLTYGWEKILETYYSLGLWKSLSTSLDYQFIAAPAFNRDRGPVHVVAARLHWQL